jgi:hypothetical protein
MPLLLQHTLCHNLKASFLSSSLEGSNVLAMCMPLWVCVCGAVCVYVREHWRMYYTS